MSNFCLENQNFSKNCLKIRNLSKICLKKLKVCWSGSTTPHKFQTRLTPLLVADSVVHVSITEGGSNVGLKGLIAQSFCNDDANMPARINTRRVIDWWQPEFYCMWAVIGSPSYLFVFLPGTSSLNSIDANVYRAQRKTQPFRYDRQAGRHTYRQTGRQTV